MSENTKPEGNDKPQVPSEVPTEENQGIPTTTQATPVKKSFVSPEDIKAATQPPTKSEEVKAKEEMEHPYILLVRLVDKLCVLVEQQNKSDAVLAERFDKFFTLFESLAKPKTSVPVSTPPSNITSSSAQNAVPDKPVTQSPPTVPAPVPAQTVSKDVEDKIARMKTQLGPDLTAKLIFDATSSSNMILVKTTSFLGSELFSKVAAVIRENGGSYVSAGRASHFQVPKLEAKQ